MKLSVLKSIFPVSGWSSCHVRITKAVTGSNVPRIRDLPKLLDNVDTILDKIIAPKTIKRLYDTKPLGLVIKRFSCVLIRNH